MDAIPLLDCLGLFVADGVYVSAGEVVAVLVSIMLEPIVIVPVTQAEPVLEITAVGVILLDTRPVDDCLVLTEAEPVVVALFVRVMEAVIVLLIGPVCVSRNEPVLCGEVVDVLEDDMDLVWVVDAEFVFVDSTDNVVVFVARALTDPVTLDVDVLELDTERLELGDPVEVFEDDIDWLVVLEPCMVPDAFVVAVNEGDAEDVFDDAMVLV